MHKILIAVLLCFSVQACGPLNLRKNYYQYDEIVVPGKTKILNLSDTENSTERSEIYLDSDASGSHHRFWLATYVDGVPVPKYLQKVKNDLNSKNQGAQAIALTPGKHTIQLCWISVSRLGGGETCGQTIKDVDYQKGKVYWLKSAYDAEKRATLLWLEDPKTGQLYYGQKPSQF
ncbi:MAG: hypothetical protein H0W44_10155 [Gammaproteobacteria bacterium]|nr:hypothetical protein [Gammaproteobacteria bacterium]